MKNPCEDTYFLDRDLAYQTALAHNTVELGDGKLQKQVCYYDGVPFQYAPKNLVNVPAELFADYFAAHSNRIPKRINTRLAQTKSSADRLQPRIYSMLSLIEKIHRKNQR